MKKVAQDEPPSGRPSPFLVGRDSCGNWVVQDQRGIRGGLFVDRAQALRYVRSENGRRSPAFVMVNGVFDLDMTRISDAKPRCEPVGVEPQRRVA